MAPKPEILAPAGNTDSFLAALAAGADGIYLGLKNFSARMAARNFGLAELARLIDLAHQHDCRVYVAMNNMLKPDEITQAYRLTSRLATQIFSDGLIIQDLGMVDIARQSGFTGSIAFSTLANITSPIGLKTARSLGADRVIIPRELSIDEMRLLGKSCPEGLELECFVHGALCYCVSGRCYWSSYMGGRSGLRGRCTQPCRRKYTKITSRQTGRERTRYGNRLFSCQDLELAPTIRALLTVPHLVSWKIEGRKKGPHYVYHAVTAYKLLRDHAEDAQQRKLALEILDQALDRPGVRARFLPQKSNQPMAPFGQTGSGMLAGKIKIEPDGSTIIKPHFDLIPLDLLRIGAEDENWHTTVGVKRKIPKGGTLALTQPRHKTPASGTPVYLIDRKEPELIKILTQWHKKLERMPLTTVKEVGNNLSLPEKTCSPSPPDMLILDQPPRGKPHYPQNIGKNSALAIWLAPKNAELSLSLVTRLYFWLPPAIWADNENRYQQAVQKLIQKGAQKFVCNAPWQRGLFPQDGNSLELIAGPFCNIANCLALLEMAKLGFKAAFISPELPKDELQKLPQHSPIPLGIIIKGYWPVGVSRFGLAGLSSGEAFRGTGNEVFWSLDRRDLTWIYPGWPVDMLAKKAELQKWGYAFFGWLEEKPPKDMPVRERPGLFNWDGQLL